MTTAAADYQSLVQFKLLHENAVPPTRGTAFSGAFDIYIPEAGHLWPQERKVLGTGLAHRVHEGYSLEMRVDHHDGTHRHVQVPFALQGLLFGRSGLAAREGIRPFFAPCLIDHDYRGEILVVLENASTAQFSWEAGERLCQIMYLPTYMGPCSVTEVLCETARGAGGLGHTGRK